MEKVSIVGFGRFGKTLYRLLKGSFNEEAIKHYFEGNGITKTKIKYLYTSENVLKALNRGDIDFGQFALENTLGGIVGESLTAMSKYRFEIIDEFFIQIRHFLMKRKDVDFNQLDTIMAHPQVLKQCKNNLSKRYGDLVQRSGEGDLVDTAMAAKALAEGKLSVSTAILGPKGLAELYDFDIIDTELQDSQDNYTTFLIVKP